MKHCTTETTSMAAWMEGWTITPARVNVYHSPAECVIDQQGDEIDAREVERRYLCGGMILTPYSAYRVRRSERNA